MFLNYYAQSCDENSVELVTRAHGSVRTRSLSSTSEFSLLKNIGKKFEMEKSNSEKIQDIYSIAQSTHKEADENKKFCEGFYESNTKQGTIATTAFGLLQKQLQVL